MCRTRQPHFTDPRLVGYEIYDFWNPTSGRLHLAAFKIRRRGRQEKGRKRHTNKGKPEGRQLHTQQRRKWNKRARTDRSDTEMDTEGGGEMGTSQSHKRHKKGHMTLTDSDEEAFVDFVKDHKELYDKTNGHFQDKARKECL